MYCTAKQYLKYRTAKGPFWVLLLLMVCDAKRQVSHTSEWSQTGYVAKDDWIYEPPGSTSKSWENRHAPPCLPYDVLENGSPICSFKATIYFLKYILSATYSKCWLLRAFPATLTDSVLALLLDTSGHQVPRLFCQSNLTPWDWLSGHLTPSTLAKPSPQISLIALPGG